VAFRDEGAHRCRCGLGSGTHGVGHGGQRQRRDGAAALVHGEDAHVFADAFYQGVDKRAETQGVNVKWH
jgi:hypothetical protein